MDKNNTSSSKQQSLSKHFIKCSTPIPNFFIDDLMPFPGLPKPYFRVLLVLWRQTVGWDKDQDYLSISQIQKRAGVGNRQVVIRAGKFWAEAGLFTRRSDGARGMTRYRINRDLDAAQAIGAVGELVSKRNQFQNRTRSGSKTGTRLVPKRHTQRNTQFKDTQQEKETEKPFPLKKGGENDKYAQNHIF